MNFNFSSLNPGPNQPRATLPEGIPARGERAGHAIRVRQQVVEAIAHATWRELAAAHPTLAAEAQKLSAPQQTATPATWGQPAPNNISNGANFHVPASAEVQAYAEQRGTSPVVENTMTTPPTNAAYESMQSPANAAVTTGDGFAGPGHLVDDLTVEQIRQRVNTLTQSAGQGA